MLKFDADIGAYVLKFDDAIICWEEEPEDDHEEYANDVRKAYNSNIKHIAETIYDEIKEMFDIKDVDEVVSKLGKPQIYPDDGQVVYCESSFDDSHIITFEYTDDEFNEIEYVSVDG